MKSLWAADQSKLDRYQTVQNNFSLINRRCESELAQVCRREEVSLLPYSPLGGGVLTGKYLDENPVGARFRLTSMMVTIDKKRWPIGSSILAP